LDQEDLAGFIKIEVLSILRQNPGTKILELLGLKTFLYAKPEQEAH